MSETAYHMSLGLSADLWNDLLGSALPFKVVDGEFELAANLKSAVKALKVRQRVSGLLEDRQSKDLIVKAKNRAGAVWRRRRHSVYRRVNEVIEVDGTWRLEMDDVGTKFKYGQNKVDAEACLKGVAEGQIRLLKKNIEVPFYLEKKVAVSMSLKEIHYDEGQEAVIGSLGDLALHVGDQTVMQLLAKLGESLLERQLQEHSKPVPLIQKSQVEELVKPLGGSLKTEMGVEAIALDINDDMMQLKLRFGFGGRTALPGPD